ncbi:hypothetical protein [Crenothrix sp.]|uniref:hypothetical protein n=1 Tax=Crenothrix sp. TaxID=3100433 RepID=UPI00374CACB8
MNHARLIYEDTPAFIPVPKEMQHRKTEITFLPLDDGLASESSTTSQTTVELCKPELAENKSALLSDEFFASLEKTVPEKPRSLLELIGKGKGCFKNAAEIDAFIRAERDAWED